MKNLKFLYLIGIIALAIGCQNDDGIGGHTICETPIDLGEFLLSNESIESGLIYESYNNVYFRNDNNDTLVFAIYNTDSLSRYNNNIFSYNCTLDSTIQISGEYDYNAKSLQLINLNQDLTSDIDDLRLVISTVLHLDNPELKLFGDFLYLFQIKLQTPFSSVNYIMEFPIDLRTYPLEIQEMNGFDFIEEIEQNGNIYKEVFSSNEVSDSDLKIQMTKTDGIISIEESNGVIWYLIGYD